jgi:hypothetical protein
MVGHPAAKIQFSHENWSSPMFTLRTLVAAVALPVALLAGATACSAATTTPHAASSPSAGTPGSASSPSGAASAAPSVPSAPDASASSGNGTGTGTGTGTGGGAGTGTGAGAGTTALASCTAAAITPTLIAQPQRTSGTTRMAMLQLTNTSGAKCRLKGWASVKLVNASGATVDLPIALVNQPGGATTVDLPPGTTASAGVKWTVCTKSGADCPVGNSMDVVLPNNGGTKGAALDGFPAPERSDITVKSMQIGTIQPSREGVVAW